MRNFKVSKLVFEDDAFALDKAWLFKFSELYCKKIKLPFTCQAIATFLDEQTIKELKKMNCIAVRLGVETGNENIRRKVLNKDVLDEHIINAGRLIKKYDMSLQTFNMVGIYGETFDDALQTLLLNRKIRTDFAWCSILKPYEGTKIREKVSKKEEEYANKTYFNFPPKRLSKEIVNLHRFMQFFIQLNLNELLVKELVKLPPLNFFQFIFEFTYSYSVRKIQKIPFIPFIKMAFLSKNYMR